MVAIPKSLTAIDASWLTAALQEAGHDAPEITEVLFKPMPGVVGMMGEVGILTVSYTRETQLPSSFFGKCPLDNDVARYYNAVMLYYPREAGFYRDLAQSVPLRVPTCWVNNIDGDRCILLVDHVDAPTGDVLKSASFSTMEMLVGDLAALHGRFWMDERLRDLPWLPDWLEPAFLNAVPIFQAGWTKWIAGHPDLMSADLRWLSEARVNEPLRFLESYVARPWTFIHGDFQLDNMLFPDDGAVIVDWQGCMRCFPGFDLGWLLASSASDETIAKEDDLLDHYRSRLLASGGPAWSRDDVLDDLAWAMSYYVPGMTVPLLMDFSTLGAHGERMHRRFQAFLDRCITAAERWDTTERLRDQV
jgi:hypothetical protein